MKKWPGQVFQSNFQSKSRRVGEQVHFTGSSVHAGKAGRYVVVVVGKLNTLPVILVSVCAPNWDDSTFFNELFSNKPNMSPRNLTTGGDTNCAFSS